MMVGCIKHTYPRELHVGSGVVPRLAVPSVNNPLVDLTKLVQKVTNGRGLPSIGVTQEHNIQVVLG